MKIIIIGIVIALFATTRGQIIQPSIYCPMPPVVLNFNIAQFFGKWFEVQRYNHEYQKGELCVTETFTEPLTGSRIPLTKTMVKVDELGWTQTSKIEEAWLDKPFGMEGRLKVKADPTTADADATDLLILKTDYIGYAILWSCRPSKTAKSHSEYTWILSRTPTLTEEQRNEIDGYIISLDSPILGQELQLTDQSEASCTPPASITPTTSTAPSVSSSVITSATGPTVTGTGASTATEAGPSSTVENTAAQSQSTSPPTLSESTASQTSSPDTTTDSAESTTKGGATWITASIIMVILTVSVNVIVA